MLAHPSKSNSLRSAAQDEAARLKAEILQQGNELARLEQLAGSVSTSRQTSGLDPWPRPELLSPSNGSRSSSTGKIIEQLQHEIDHLKLESRAAYQNYESEKSAREALRLKCDHLEMTIGTLRTERQAHALTLQRSDKALSDAKSTAKALQATLQTATSARETMEVDLHRQAELIKSMTEQIESERDKQELATNQYRALSQELSQLRVSLTQQVTDLGAELTRVRANLQEDRMQTRTAKEDIILFNDQQLLNHEGIKKTQDLLEKLRRQQVDLMSASTSDLLLKIQELSATVETKHNEVESLQKELDRIKASLITIKSISA